MGINQHQIRSYIKHFFTATRKGHNVHSPFVYTLCEEVFYNTANFYDFEELQKVRSTLLNDETELLIEDFGAGSHTFNGNKRKVKHIAGRGISTKQQSELLYRLVNFLNPKTVIELGTSLGLNTLYLSKASKSAKVFTIEGSSSLNSFGESLGARYEAGNCHYIKGKFDEEFHHLLGNVSTVDVLYIDGNHIYEATLNYFNMALAKATSNSVFIFDDIYWSSGMTRAWDEIKKDPKVTLTVDAFYFGFVFFRPEVLEKVHVKILL